MIYAYVLNCQRHILLSLKPWSVNLIGDVSTKYKYNTLLGVAKIYLLPECLQLAVLDHSVKDTCVTNLSGTEIMLPAYLELKV